MSLSVTTMRHLWQWLYQRQHSLRSDGVKNPRGQPSDDLEEKVKKNEDS